MGGEGIVAWPTNLSTVGGSSVLVATVNVSLLWHRMIDIGELSTITEVLVYCQEQYKGDQENLPLTYVTWQFDKI